MIISTVNVNLILKCDFIIHYFRHRPAIGELLSAFAGAFPVAFLESHLNKNNRNSLIGQKELKGAQQEGTGTVPIALMPSLRVRTVFNETDEVCHVYCNF